jgi:putative transposase
MSVSKRQSYHTHIKYLVREGLLSSELLMLIPRTNRHRWGNEAADKHTTMGLNALGIQEFELMRSFAQDKHWKRIYSAYLRISKFVLSIVHQLPAFHSRIKYQSKAVVELIARVRGLIGLKRVLGIFDISVQTFRNWSAQSVTQCFESFTKTCNRIFHNQLSRHEVVKLKEMVTNSQFQYWPISSIALFALRKNILPLSLNTWYKYVNKLGLRRPRPGSRRKKNAVSVRAERPHQIWHADITVFVTADQIRHYIYVVIDNYSRKIISWLIADSVKAEYRKNTINVALKFIHQDHPQITLITDGGPENKLQSFLDSLAHSVQHKRALVDVHYSNSLIEAFFKTGKYSYLYRMNIRDREDLNKAFEFIVQDYNERPHVSLHGLTPNEAELNIPLNKEQLHTYIENATLERKDYNRVHRCIQCK